MKLYKQDTIMTIKHTRVNARVRTRVSRLEREDCTHRTDNPFPVHDLYDLYDLYDLAPVAGWEP